jgi:hypothetical protein
MLLPLKFLAAYSGIVSKTTGSVLSLGPPEGLLTFAQAAIRTKSIDKSIKCPTLLLFID